jgi:hypothetical protein
MQNPDNYLNSDNIKDYIDKSLLPFLDARDGVAHLLCVLDSVKARFGILFYKH